MKLLLPTVAVAFSVLLLQVVPQRASGAIDLPITGHERELFTGDHRSVIVARVVEVRELTLDEAMKENRSHVAVIEPIALLAGKLDPSTHPKIRVEFWAGEAAANWVKKPPAKGDLILAVIVNDDSIESSTCEFMPDRLPQVVISGLADKRVLETLKRIQEVRAHPDPDPKAPPAEESEQAYFDGLWGTGFYDHRADVILGRVVRKMKKPRGNNDIGYVLDVIADYRGELRKHDMIGVSGVRMHPGSNVGPMGELPSNGVVLVAAAPMKQPGQYQHRAWQITPFSVACDRAVNPAQIHRISRALEETRRLVPVDGRGPISHKEAEALLKSQDLMLWALGASLLAYEGTAADMAQLQEMATNDKNMTAARAVWIHYLFTFGIIPQDHCPTRKQAHALLVRFLRDHRDEFSRIASQLPLNASDSEIADYVSDNRYELATGEDTAPEKALPPKRPNENELQKP